MELVLLATDSAVNGALQGGIRGGIIGALVGLIAWGGLKVYKQMTEKGEPVTAPEAEAETKP
jgi:hypothetical protein